MWRTTKSATVLVPTVRISIHVLRVEDDLPSPAMRALTEHISIHVLRVEDDANKAVRAAKDKNFNPRPPCGGRPLFRGGLPKNKGFQSTSSVWRTTPERLKCVAKRLISIHVLRVEDDTARKGMTEHKQAFQSTSSVWRTTWTHCPKSRRLINFNPRPPCGGRPRECNRWLHRPGISIHVLRVEDDRCLLFRLIFI